MPQAEIGREPPSSRTLLFFAGPVAGGLLAQNLMGLVTTGMVGRLGEDALAGVGVAGALFTVLLALLYGAPAAIQALVARSLGAGRPPDAAASLTGGLIIWLSLALVVVGASYIGAPLLLPHLLPARAAALGDADVRGLAPIAFFLAANMGFAAYWNGAGQPRRAFYISTLQLPVHIALCYALIFGHFGAPALGVFGAGLASSLAAACGTLMHLVLALRLAPIPHLMPRPRGPVRATIRPLLSIGLPISLQQSALAFGIAIYFTIIAQMGVMPAAALNVIGSLLVLPSLITSGVGTAVSTFVGAELGAGANAERTGWRAARLAVLTVAPFSLGLFLFPEAALRLFVGNPATVAFAAMPLRTMALSICSDAFLGVLISALTGAGATRLAAATSFLLQWLLQLPLVWFVGTRLGYGFTGVAVVFTLRSLVEAAIIAALWRSGGWKHALSAASAVSPPIEAAEVLRHARRVAIMGGAGAGKSTLARLLAARLGLPVIHLDRLLYGPKWTEVDRTLFQQRVADIAEREAWIVDGTYSESRDLLLPRADVVLWLDQPAPRRLWRSWNKTRHPGRPRADRPDGCEEAFGWTYMRTILSFGRWTPATEAWVRARATSGTVFRIKGDRERAQLLAQLSQIEVFEEAKPPAAWPTGPASRPSPAASGASRQ